MEAHKLRKLGEKKNHPTGASSFQGAVESSLHRLYNEAVSTTATYMLAFPEAGQAEWLAYMEGT